MGGLFGGGSSQRAAKKAQKKAEEENRRSREMQAIANDRSLAAEQERAEQTPGPSRKKIRGRRLFSDNVIPDDSENLA